MDERVRTRALALGVTLWIVPTVVAILMWRGPGLVRWLLLLAVVVLVPVGAPLLGASGRLVRWLQLAGAPVAVAVLLPAGPVAALLATPWLLLGLVLAATASWRLLRSARAGWWHRLPSVAAAGYLAVGAAWLVADRLGIAPLGFDDPFTALTAVHFHHAGAVATTVTSVTAARVGTRPARVAAVLVMVAPPLVGTGFLGVDLLLLVGAVMLAVGLWTWAAVVLRATPSQLPGAAVRVAAVAVLAPMALAVQWAAGAVFGTPALSVPVMAATHGVLNALGFGLPAVFGLTRARGPRPVHVTGVVT